MERAVSPTKERHDKGIRGERRVNGQSDNDAGERCRYEDAKRKLTQSQDRMARVLDKIENMKLFSNMPSIHKNTKSA